MFELEVHEVVFGILQSSDNVAEKAFMDPEDVLNLFLLFCSILRLQFMLFLFFSIFWQQGF